MLNRKACPYPDYTIYPNANKTDRTLNHLSVYLKSATVTNGWSFKYALSNILDQWQTKILNFKTTIWYISYPI